MTSKGLDVYAFTPESLLNASPINFKVEEPNGDASTWTVGLADAVKNRHYEIDFYWLHPATDGQYTFTVTGMSDGSCEIAPISGNVSDCNMCNMLTNQQSTSLSTATGGIASFGFYDAGGGYDSSDFPYTSHHQSYVYLGDSHRSGWMGHLVSENASLGTAPFSTFVLPGGHDAGMNTSANLAHVATRAGTIAAIMTLVLGWMASFFAIAISAITAILGTLAASRIEQILIDLAITQKDTTTKMLDLGTRYFDFRPGYNAKIDVEGTEIPVGEGDGLYHQHNFIPGMAFTDFLNELVTWLDANPTEIVVVSLGFAGFYNDGMKPTANTLTSDINTAVANSTTGLTTGDVSDADTSYNDLISAKKRLLFFNNGVGVNDAKKYDSYSDGSYTTLDPNSIVGALNGMQPVPVSGDQNYIVLQLQGTASGVSALWPGYPYNLIHKSTKALSPLLMTKAQFDLHTYAWSQSHLPNFSYEYPLVVLNDFVDPAMSHIAQEATLLRLSQQST